MLRGIENRQEVDPSLLLRDTRTLGQRIVDFFKNRTNVALMLVVLAGATFALPGFADIFFIFGMGSFLFAYIKKQKLPFRMPKVANIKDYNDLIPGIKKPNQSRGIAFFGNEMKTT
ncbi:MAG: phosphoesterase, partial [Legionellales bacterium]|nr:phosphoesterase [Legionellales bacterium]